MKSQIKFSTQIDFRVDGHEKHQKISTVFSPAYKTEQTEKKWIPKNCRLRQSDRKRKKKRVCASKGVQPQLKRSTAGSELLRSLLGYYAEKSRCRLMRCLELVPHSNGKTHQAGFLGFSDYHPCLFL